MWELLWKITFIAGISIFALLAVVVTIGGARDIKRLLVDLANDDSEPEEE
jgi:hypothetical protein